MTVAAIRTAAAAIVAALTSHGGFGNVYEEEPAEAEELTRIYNGRVQFWHVRLADAAPGGGIGYTELRHRIAIEGWIGVSSTDNPTDGITGHDIAARMLSLLCATFRAGTNCTLSGTALGIEDVIPEPIIRTVRSVAGKDVPCLRVALSFIAIEDA